jgi:hypothetical protein
VRADHPPAKAVVQARIDLLGESDARENDKKYAKWDETHAARKNSHKQKHCIEISQIPSEARDPYRPEECVGLSSEGGYEQKGIEIPHPQSTRVRDFRRSFVLVNSKVLYPANSKKDDK